MRYAGKVLTVLMATAMSFFILMASVGCDSKQDASGAAEDFIGLYVGGDFAAAYAMLDESSYELQNNWTADYYASKSESSYGGPYELVDLVFKPEGREGDEVNFIIQGTLSPLGGGESMAMAGEITMIEYEETWKVSYIDWAAVPESSIPYDM